MPEPVVEPTPRDARELRFVVPLLAQEASYFAASARIASFFASSIEDSTLGIWSALQKCSTEHTST
jgi:hypothetical protein